MRARGPAPTPPRAAWREWRRSTFALVGHARQLLGNESQRTDHPATLACPADPEREGIEDTNELNSGAAHEVVGNLDRLGKGLQSRQMGRSAAVVLQACPPPIKVFSQGVISRLQASTPRRAFQNLEAFACLPLCHLPRTISPCPLLKEVLGPSLASCSGHKDPCKVIHRYSRSAAP
jgi:hypothetical protein